MIDVNATFSKDFSDARISHIYTCAQAQAVGANFNPEQGLGQTKLPGVLESHTQTTIQVGLTLEMLAYKV